MPTGGSCLLDSNILQRIGKSDDPQYAAIAPVIRPFVLVPSTASFVTSVSEVLPAYIIFTGHSGR
jgi:hypothetical protein